MQYQTLRPPLSIKFELPTREELLKLKTRDLVKVIFQVENDTPERLWLKLTTIDDTDLWFGKIDNDPIGEKIKKVLPDGSEISFHSLDIIAICNE